MNQSLLAEPAPLRVTCRRCGLEQHLDVVDRPELETSLGTFFQVHLQGGATIDIAPV